MNISSKTLIAGHSALKVRNCLRRYRGLPFNWRAAAISLKIDEAEARRDLRRLHKMNLIQPSEHQSGESIAYTATLEGNALANASAARRISRATAERHLAAFLQRVKSVNRNTTYLHRVESAVVFGSFLTDKTQLSDVDIALKLAPRIRDGKKFLRLTRLKVDEARRKGHTFHNVIEELSWPEGEVLLVLKARSRVIALHDLESVSMMKDIRCQVLIGDEDQIRRKFKGQFFRGHFPS